MNAADFRTLGQCAAALSRAGRIDAAYGELAPVLEARTPFAQLDCLGAAIGAGELEPTNAFLDQIAARRTMGGWVVIASALRQQLDRDLAGALARCRAFAVAADVWYATDIFGERVPGPALVTHFRPALALLRPWRTDDNRWVRRMTGVAVHFWAKRAHGAPGTALRAGTLLAFLAPMFEERDTDAVKGAGWGLKTLGKYYPDALTVWLARQLARGRQPRALMLRKALTYLPAEQRARATGRTRA